MKKLEPGMLCRVVRDERNPDNIGKIVTLVEWVGTPPISGPARNGRWNGSDWWEIEEEVFATSKFGGRRQIVNYISERKIQPINPDHQPADEEWQADFKRMLSDNKQTVRSTP